MVTDHRANPDFVRYLLEQVYTTAHRVHLVLDNLNTHFPKCFEDVLGTEQARALLRRVVFHCAPKHGGWLNMVEIESAYWISSACRIETRSSLKSMLGYAAAMPTKKDRVVAHSARRR